MTEATDLLPGFTERFLTVRGVRIRLYEGGEGPPLLLLHGFGGAAWNFTELAPLLPGRRLLVPDLPGHGGSAPLPAASMSALADAVAELLPGPLPVLGHSMGGVVALRLAERRPELVTGLVLAAPAGLSSSTRRVRGDARARRVRPAGAHRRPSCRPDRRARPACANSSSVGSRSRMRTRSPSAPCTAS